jgi:hypothetical protein
MVAKKITKQDTQTTTQDLYNALLDLKAASKENLVLLTKFLDKSLGESYAKNAKLTNASKAILKEIVREDIVYAKAKINPAIAANLTNQLDHTLQALIKINNTRKQLLADADKVKLSVTMLTGENLPKAKGQIYNKSINKILVKVTNMANMTDQLQHNLQLEMRHGKNYSKMSPQELAALGSGIDTNLSSLTELNKQMKTEMKKGQANTDEPTPDDQKPTPFRRTLRRGN